MDSNILGLAIFAFVLGPPGGLTDTGKVAILSPADCGIVDGYRSVEFKYDASFDVDRKRLHLEIDGKRFALALEAKGRVMLDGLKSGRHRICLVLDSKKHAEQSCVGVTSR